MRQHFNVATSNVITGNDIVILIIDSLNNDTSTLTFTIEIEYWLISCLVVTVA